MTKVANGWRPKIPIKWYQTMPNIVNLIERCWNQDQFLRPTFSEIFENLENWSGKLGFVGDAESIVARSSVPYSKEELAHIKEGKKQALKQLKLPTRKHLF